MKLRVLAVAACLAWLYAPRALACTSCMRGAEGPMLDAEWSSLQRTQDRAWRNV